MNYARCYALLNRLPTTDREELKRGLVSQYTGGRTDSLREMTPTEYDALCRRIEETLGVHAARQAAYEELRRKRSAVLKRMQRYGVDTTDWNAVDRFCQHPRIGTKPFRRLDGGELDELRLKLDIILRKRQADTVRREQLS